MLGSIINLLAKKYFSLRFHNRIKPFLEQPLTTQQKVFQNLIRTGSITHFGKEHGLSPAISLHAFQKQVPVRAYEELFPYIERIMKGEENVLWRGKVHWFAKSSGTTNARSKFIPITNESLYACHYAAGRDMLATYYFFHPDANLFQGKALSIGGSHEINPLNEHSRYGDLSAVLIQNMPAFYEGFRTPPKSVALMSEWEAKIEKMAQITAKQNVSSIAGVPTWTLVLLKKILQITQKQHIKQVWPNLQVFFHGAVSFEPYKVPFQQLAPNIHYMEIYNASEGYFAFQTEPTDPSMLLLLNHGIFYEFIPLTQTDQPYPDSIPIPELEIGKTYALVITTNGGLWRYLIGDTVTITSIKPLKIRIAGRTKHFINAFGEELMVSNTDQALAFACHQTQASIKEYTAAPIFFGENQAGSHEWLIEFEKTPNDLNLFFQLIDQKLQELNSDYAAKRYKDLALRFPVFHIAKTNLFYEWLKSQNKLGGQHKVPRLSNDRTLIEHLLKLNYN